MTTNQTMDYAELANKLSVVTEAISTPEQATGLSYEAYAGIRTVVEAAAATLLESGEAERNGTYRTGYKLLALASMIETPEKARELMFDTWSGFRIMLEEVIETLFDAELQPA